MWFERISPWIGITYEIAQKKKKRKKNKTKEKKQPPPSTAHLTPYGFQILKKQKDLRGILLGCSG